MLLFFQSFHVSSMVHWCMIGVILLLPLSFPWSAQAARYIILALIDQTEMVCFQISYSCNTEDFSFLLNCSFGFQKLVPNCYVIDERMEITVVFFYIAE